MPDWGAILPSSLLSGAISGAVAILSTVLVERLGGKVGGVIATTPLTYITATYAFIVESPSHEGQVSLAFTGAGLQAHVIFLLMWKELPPLLPRRLGSARRLWIMIVLSMIVWLAVAACVILAFNEIAKYANVLALGWAFFALHVLTSSLAALRAYPSPSGKKPVRWYVYLSRGVFTLVAIFLAALLVKTGNGLIGAIASILPAILLTTMIAMWVSQDESVLIGATGPMSVGGCAWSGYACALQTCYYYFHINVFGSIAIALVFCIVAVSIPFLYYLSWRESKIPPSEIKSFPSSLSVIITAAEVPQKRMPAEEEIGAIAVEPECAGPRVSRHSV